MIIDPIKAATRIARTAHAGQLDKAGNPYIDHPLRVMESMAPDDVEGRVVAVLHDVVEDTSVTLDDLRDYGFSETIVVAVEAITHRKAEPRFDYLRRIAANPLARRVKLKDIQDNEGELRLMRLADPAERARLREKYRVAREALANPQAYSRFAFPNNEAVADIIALRDAKIDQPFLIDPTLPFFGGGITSDGRVVVHSETMAENLRVLLCELLPRIAP